MYIFACKMDIHISYIWNLLLNYFYVKKNVLAQTIYHIYLIIFLSKIYVYLQIPSLYHNIPKNHTTPNILKIFLHKQDEIL